MAFDYINEAFKKLALIEESVFNNSVDGINQLSTFMDEDDDTIRVIDPEAEDSDDVQDSYIGKVIVNCNICHSHIFENKEELVIDEEGNVNSEKDCPYCGEQEGFTIVGEIRPYAEQVSEEPQEDVVTDDTTDEPLEETLGTAIGLGLATGAARAIGDKVTSSILGDDINDDETDEVLTEEPKMSRASKRALKESSSDLTEDFKEVSITTEDQKMEMTSDENGKVTVTTEPVQNTETPVEEETIAPVSAETQEEILDNNDVVEEPAEESDELDFDFDDIDEEGMDELGESYLRKIYENVKSFKTSSVGANENSLVIEGVITFNSGAKKKTGFIFEAKDANTKGQLRFIGSNKQLSESSNAFTLVGKVDNKKLFVESLKYNYTVNENTVRGVVRRK